MIRMSDGNEAQKFAEALTSKYDLKIPSQTIASAFTPNPQIPVLMSRAAFRADAVRTAPEVRRQRERRNFLKNMIGLVAISVPFLLWLKAALAPPAQVPVYASNPNPQPGERLLANASSISTGQALTLNDPNFGPMLLIHLTSGQFVAYSAICTHAGCTVQFNNHAQEIACPCHGAVFDPNNNAQVLAGPAPYPLQKIGIRYDQGSGNIYLQG